MHMLYENDYLYQTFNGNILGLKINVLIAAYWLVLFEFNPKFLSFPNPCARVVVTKPYM